MSNQVLKKILGRGFATWLFWTIFGLLFVLQSYVYSHNYERPFDWTQNLVYQLSDYWLWALLTPLIFVLSKKVRWERGRRARSLALFVLVGLALAPVQRFSGIFLSFEALSMLGELDRTVSESLSVAKFGIIGGSLDSLVMYAIILGVFRGFDYYQRYREHKLRASRLEAQLAKSELQALKMQLHPHFLFNTLHTISSLMNRDVEAAEKMIARLSDLLRQTLQNVGVQEVTLKQELDFLQSYLEIEEIRFQDRLRINLNIDPRALDAFVPNLLLQPLVENAVRHGIAAKASSGKIGIEAQKRNGRLWIRVTDDGPGLKKDLKEGIGLSNTRARLKQLYNGIHEFALTNQVSGGASVELSIPFRKQALGPDREEIA